MSGVLGEQGEGQRGSVSEEKSPGAEAATVKPGDRFEGFIPPRKRL